MGACCVSTNKSQDLKNQAKGAGIPIKAPKEVDVIQGSGTLDKAQEAAGSVTKGLEAGKDDIEKQAAGAIENV